MEKQAPPPTTNTFSFFNEDIKKILSMPNFVTSIAESMKPKILNIAAPTSNQDRIVDIRQPLMSPKTPGFVPVVTNSAPPRPLTCNCKSSQCIKLYCECFHNGSFCKNCSCKDCHNEFDNETRSNAISVIKQKNPNAFEPKFKATQTNYKPILTDNRPRPLQSMPEPFIEFIRGCNCKNSNCTKKYCECYQHGIECSSKCKCVNCQNGNPERNGINGFRSINGSIYPNLNQGELKHLLLEKLLDIKRTKFPRAD